MTAPFFYGDTEALAAAKIGDDVTVSGDEGRHAVTVKRLTVGEELLVGDGLGTCVRATVAAVRGKDELTASVDEVVQVERPTPRVTVVQALIKGERMERAIETLTEANVDEIVLWQAERSIARVNAGAEAKALTKLSKRAEQAAKQARRAWIPTVTGVLSTSEVIAQLPEDSRIVALHEDSSVALPELITVGSATATQQSGVVLIVGPEGGISATEIEELTAVGVKTARIGTSVLRASTAGTVALGWVMGAIGRWSVGDSGS